LHTRCADLVINHLQLCFTADLTADLSVWEFSGCLVCGRITRQYAATEIRINDQTLNNPDDGALWLTWLIFWTLPIVSSLKPTTGFLRRRVESRDGEPTLVSPLERARYITTVGASSPYENRDSSCPSRWRMSKTFIPYSKHHDTITKTGRKVLLWRRIPEEQRSKPHGSDNGNNTKFRENYRSSMQITLTYEMNKRPVMEVIIAVKDITAIIVHRFNPLTPNDL
jgi:hypothetical protein